MEHSESSNIANCVEVGSDIEVESEKPQIIYVLPSLRYATFFKIILFIDWIVSISLWLTGGHEEYFITNITDFHFTQSVFDLALLVTLRTGFLILCVDYLENLFLILLDHPFNSNAQRKKKVLFSLAILFCIANLAYTSTKCIWMAVNYFHSHVLPHLTYVVLFCWSPATSLLEFLGMILYLRYLKKLGALRSAFDPQTVQKPINIRRLLSLVKPEMNLIVSGVLALFVSSGSTVLAPLFFGKVIDAAQHSMAKLNRTVLILLAVYIIGAVGSTLRAWLFTLAGQKFVARLRKNLFQAMIKQEVAFFDTNRTGELTNRLASDTQVIQNSVTVNISMLSRNIVQSLGSLVFMFILSPRLTGILLAVVPIVSIGVVQYGSYVQKVRKKFQDALAKGSTVAEETLSSIRTVRSFAGEEKSFSLYSIEIDGSYKLGKKLALAQGGFEGIFGLCFSGSMLLVLWYGGKLLNAYIHGDTSGITPGVLTSFLLYGIQVGISFASISALFGDFMQAVGASFRLFELLDRQPIIPLRGGKVLTAPKGRIELRDVQFTYPTRPECPVLKNLSFILELGQVVALVGPSGGGKSTIVTLIERFYDPDSGTILFDDEDIKGIDLVHLRQQISRVEQEPVLFACSIKENIAYGREATMDEIIAVAKEANAHDFISSFEEGYDALVGERGVRLSGGQKQRIAIARALLMNPKVLLLDEATSALDAESEHLVKEAIEKAMKGRSVLVIAHRLSTVKHADLVLVVDEGRIIESGTHQDLLNADGVYKKLVLRQLSSLNEDK